MEDKKIVYDANTSFLKLGKNIYAVNLVSNEGLDIENKIVEYHKKVLVDTVEEITKGTIREEMDEWRSCVRELNEFDRMPNNEGQYMLSTSKDAGCKFYVSGSKIFKYVIMDYAPTYICGTKGYANNEYVDALEEIIGDLPNKFEININYPMTLKRDMVVAVNMLSTGRNKSVYTLDSDFYAYQTFHTFSGGDVCQGSYKDNGGLWTDDYVELKRRINAINLDSLAYGGELLDFINGSDGFVLIESTWTTEGGQNG